MCKMHKMFYFVGKYSLSERKPSSALHILCANPTSLIAILLQEWKKKGKVFFIIWGYNQKQLFFLFF